MIISVPDGDSYTTATATIDIITHSRTGDVSHSNENRYNSNERFRQTDERLDQLASEVQGNVAAISELRDTAEVLLQTVSQHQNNFEVLMQEIRGLRPENRRILMHLFGEQAGEE